MSGDPSKIKIGVLSETPYLPVSKATKRAMKMATKALKD